MKFNELINIRESVRSYDESRTVSREKLLRVLEAGRLAPSAANYQPWKFVLVSSPEMLNKIRPCYNKSWFQKAPHILIVKGKHSKGWVRKIDGYNFLETDLAIAMTHMILAAAEEGLCTCWIANFDPAIVKKALGLDDDDIPFYVTPLGYPEPGYVVTGIKNRKKLEEIAVFI